MRARARAVAILLPFLLLAALIAGALGASAALAKPDKTPKPAPSSHPSHPEHPLTPNWSPAPFGGTPLPRPSGAPPGSPRALGPGPGSGLILLPDTAGDR